MNEPLPAPAHRRRGDQPSSDPALLRSLCSSASTLCYALLPLRSRRTPPVLQSCVARSSANLDGERPHADLATPCCCARKIAISSRSASDRYRSAACQRDRASAACRTTSANGCTHRPYCRFLTPAHPHNRTRSSAAQSAACRWRHMHRTTDSLQALEHTATPQIEVLRRPVESPISPGSSCRFIHHLLQRYNSLHLEFNCAHSALAARPQRATWRPGR